MPPMTGLTSGQAGEGTVTPHGERWHLRVEGMDCADCALQLEQAVSQLPGVARCQVDFASARMTLDLDLARVDRDAVVARVRSLGYDAAEERAMPMQPPRRRGAFDFLAFLLQRRQNTLTLLAGAGILLAVAASWSQATTSLAPWLYSAAAVVGGYPIARKAIGVLRFNRTLDMNLLMTLAAMGALAIGEFAEGALVVFLFSLALGFVLPAALGQFAATGQMGAAFRFSEVFALVRAAPMAFLLTLLGSVLASIVASLGIILCIIGVIFTSAWAATVTGHLYGQAYKTASASRGMPASPAY